jgi:hypothetical protein
MAQLTYTNWSSMPSMRPIKDEVHIVRINEWRNFDNRRVQNHSVSCDIPIEVSYGNGKFRVRSGWETDENGFVRVSVSYVVNG